MVINLGNKEDIKTVLEALGIKKGAKPRQPEEGGLVYAVQNQIFLYRPEDKDILIAKRKNWVRALCSHNGQLYDGGSYKAVFETLTGKKVAERKNWVWALCSHDGQLYDGGDYCAVFETLSNKEIIKATGPVTALCSVPPEIIKQILIKKGKKK